MFSMSVIFSKPILQWAIPFLLILVWMIYNIFGLNWLQLKGPTRGHMIVVSAIFGILGTIALNLILFLGRTFHAIQQ